MSTPLDRVRSVLQVTPGPGDTFTGASIPMPHGRVYGGQVLAQGLLAAAATVDGDRLPHSVHGYFLRPGAVDVPITFAVERLSDGRSFSARRTHALQDGRPILAMTTSFQLDQPGVEHGDRPAGPVPGPDDLPSSLGLLAPLDHPMAAFWVQYGAFDLRHVEPELYTTPARAEPVATQRVWIRATGPLPDDQILHRALLAFACDQVMLEPVLRRHGLTWDCPGLSVASIDHAMWWHRPVRVDEWLLYEQASPSAQGGRGLGTAAVYDAEGTLVATIAQEGMVRAG